MLLSASGQGRGLLSAIVSDGMRETEISVGRRGAGRCVLLKAILGGSRAVGRSLSQTD